MGRKRLKMKRIDNPCSRKVTYSKRKEGILKKANELSISGTDVGVLMFSPTGQLTTYASKGRVEDIFLRYIEQRDNFNERPLDDEEFLCQRLKDLKFEAEMLDKIERLEALERQLCELNQKKYEAQMKIRSYNPDISKIHSIDEAHLHQQFIINAIRKIEKMKKKKLLEEETSTSKSTTYDEMLAFGVKGSDSPTEESVKSYSKRNALVDDCKEEGPFTTGWTASKH